MIRHGRSVALIGVLFLGVAGVGCDRGDAGATTPAPSSTTMATAPPSTAARPEAATAAPRILDVPRGTAPDVDGAVDPAEWDEAVVTRADDGTELRWLHAAGSLYLGVRHDTVAAINLVVSEGDRIRILHSSAALGSAAYSQQDDGGWHLEHDFEWCCRRAADPAPRDALFAAEGWLASIGFAGELGEVEYRVALGGRELRVAVSIVEEDGTVAVWPADLLPSEREPLYGPRRESEDFDPDRWMRLVTTG
jgi:hypothetical protein